MQTPSCKYYVVSFLILALAVLMYFYAVHIVSPSRLSPVTFPIDLKVGSTKIPDFHVEIATKYSIEVVTDRNSPIEKLDCYLGSYFVSSGECKGIESPVDLSWHLSSGGVPIASGSSSEENGGLQAINYTSRYIGQFVGEPGISYQLEVQSLKDASILVSGNSRIRVSVNDMENKEQYFNSQLVKFVAMSLAYIGGTLLAGLVFNNLISRRTYET